jgi:gas vesicle protein
MDIDGLKQSFADDLPAIIVGAGTGVIVGGISGYAIGRSSSSKRKSKRKKSAKSRIKHTSRGWKQDRKRRSKQSWEVAYQKRKRKHSKSKKGIHYTKNGQPYKIMSNGRARFIKRKGGKR